MKPTKNKIIQRVVRSLRYRLLDRIVPDYIGDQYECPLCKTKLAHFLPLPAYYFRELQDNRYIHSVFEAETFNLENYMCPVCSSSDRDRLYCLYIDRFFQSADTDKKYNLLEIAPMAELRKYLRSIPQVNYRCADLNMADVDDKVDLTDMKLYKNGQFDIFICSHVLEHIPDDRKAMRELFRILSKDGWGILMVPINLNLTEDYENEAITDENERWKHFGQNDHVRLYSKNGFVSKLEDAGFRVEQMGVEDFGQETFEKCGINPRSVLYVVKK